MGYEPGGTVFLRTHHLLKSFKPFHIAIATLETSTKEINQKKKRGNLYMYLDTGLSLTMVKTGKNLRHGSRKMVEQIVVYLWESMQPQKNEN